MFGVKLPCMFNAVDHSSTGLTKQMPYRSHVSLLIHTLYIFNMVRFGTVLTKWLAEVINRPMCIFEVPCLYVGHRSIMVFLISFWMM
jgi:hypothetical protein